MCPGRFLAQDTLFIDISTILAVFDIAKAKNGDGGIDEPVVECTSGLIRFAIHCEF